MMRVLFQTQDRDFLTDPGGFVELVMMDKVVMNLNAL
jgi:hypothetical protein